MLSRAGKQHVTSNRVLLMDLSANQVSAVGEPSLRTAHLGLQHA